MNYETARGKFRISTDPSELDVGYIHASLARSYWAQGIAIATVRAAIQGSHCFGIYVDVRQIGFARVISDRATFAYLADVFIDPAYRGEGLGKWLIASILACPQFQDLRRWMLATRDAHGLYARFGFRAAEDPSRYMVMQCGERK